MRLLPGEDVIVATFNYDRMLEWALEDMRRPIRGLDDYLNGPVKVFKVHGSVNWARKVLTPTLSDLEDPGGWNPSRYLIDNAPNVMLSDEFVWTDALPIQLEEDTLAVAGLALPLIGPKHLEMPDKHKALLDAVLPQVTKILIVGWKGADADFTEMLKTVESATGVVVSPTNPEVTKANLRECTSIRLEVVPATFTTYAVERRVQALLAG